MLKKYSLALLAAVTLCSSALKPAIAGKVTGPIIVESEMILLPGLSSPSEQVLSEKLWSVRRIVAALVKVEQHDRALSLVKSINELDFQATLLLNLIADFGKAREFDRALQTLEILAAAPLKPEVVADIRASSLSDLALALAKDKQFDRALQLTQKNPDEDSRAFSTFYVAINLVADGQFERGIKLAETIAEPHLKSTSLQSIAMLLAILGNSERARQIADSLPALPPVNPSSSRQNPLLDSNSGSWGMAIYEIALSNFDFARIQSPERVALSLPKIPNRSLQAATLLNLALSAARHEKAEEILQIVGQIPEEKERDLRPSAITKDRVLQEIAPPFIQAGKLEIALPLARAITEAELQGRILSDIAVAFAEKGDIDRALQIADLIEISGIKFNTISSIAIATAEQKDIDSALQLLNEIPIPAVKILTRQYIAIASARYGDLDRALQLLEPMSPTPRNFALFGIISATTERGNLNRALELQATISDLEDRNSALVGIIIAMLKQGNIDRAFQFLGEITDADSKVNIQREIAVTLAERGEVDRAYQLFQELPERERRTNALDWMIKDLIERGNSDLALQFARKLENKAETLEFFISIAEKLIRSGQKEQALPILEEALTLL